MSTDPTDLVFVDVETTGLGPAAAVWSVCATRLDGDVLSASWRVDTSAAEPRALELGRYYATDKLPAEAAATVAETLASWSPGAILAGASVHYDRTLLERFLTAHGHGPAWSHRVLDVTTYLAGVFGWPGPCSLRSAAEAVGITWDPDEAHGAAYDTWAAVYTYCIAAGRVAPRWSTFRAAAEVSRRTLAGERLLGAWVADTDAYDTDPDDPPIEELPAAAAELDEELAS